MSQEATSLTRVPMKETISVTTSGGDIDNDNDHHRHHHRCSHVAVLAFPFGTHAAPLLAVIHRLATLWPSTHFSVFNTPWSNASILPTMMMPGNIKVHDVWDGMPEGYVLVGKHQEGIELFVKSAQESFKKGMEVAVEETGRKVSCLVSDAFFWFGAELAEEMQVPWVPFWTAGPVSLSAHFYTDKIRESTAPALSGGLGGSGKERVVLQHIPGMSEVRIGDLPEGVAFGNMGSVFSRMLREMGQALPQASAVFINSFEELDPTITNDLKSKFKTYFNIGPFNLISPPAPVPDTYGCIQWLEKQQKIASVAYISFGSVTTPPPNELVALAEGLEAKKTPFVWSLRTSSVGHLPHGFLERTKGHGIVVPWAPQVDVLANDAVGVFVTHCGWNSVLESITGGVPMICRPFFGDQRLNGRMIEDVWKIGLEVDNGVFTADGVIDSLDQILLGEKGKKMRENVKMLKELAMKAVESKGSSSNNFTALADLLCS